MKTVETKTVTGPPTTTMTVSIPAEGTRARLPWAPWVSSSMHTHQHIHDQLELLEQAWREQMLRKCCWIKESLLKCDSRPWCLKSVNTWPPNLQDSGSSYLPSCRHLVRPPVQIRLISRMSPNVQVVYNRVMYFTWLEDHIHIYNASWAVFI